MILNIIIKNYKSIKNTETELPIFGAIVGKNAAGKTNFVQSINFLKNLISTSTNDKRNSLFTIFPAEVFNYKDLAANLTIQITIKDADEKIYLLAVELKLSNNSVNKISFIEIVRESLSRIISKENEALIYTRSGDKLIDKNGKNIPLVVSPDKLVIALYNDPDVSNVRKVLDNISIPDFDSINSRDTFVSGVLDNLGLAGLLVKLRHKDNKSFDNFKKVISKLIPSISEIVEIPYDSKNKSEKEKSYLVLLEEKGLEGTLSVESISFGDLRTMFIIATAMNMEDGSTFIIEEIENGMHPKRIYELICQLQSISFKKDLQILFTTHSPRVINLLSPQNILYVNKSNEGTVVTLLSNSDENTSIQRLLESGGEITDYLNNSLK